CDVRPPDCVPSVAVPLAVVPRPTRRVPKPDMPQAASWDIAAIDESPDGRDGGLPAAHSAGHAPTVAAPRVVRGAPRPDRPRCRPQIHAANGIPGPAAG